jgi:C1A family cysteine protease
MKTTNTIQRKYGWRKQHLDRRDRKFLRAPVALPDSVDWTPKLPPCYDQGQLGSCTANAIAGAVQFLQQQQVEPLVMPSRLFIYYNEREMEGTVDSDSGAEIRDGIKSVNGLGVCPEIEWPYFDDATTFSYRPTQQCYDDAKKEFVLAYQSVNNTVLDDLRAALVHGPVVGGFSVFESFESAEVAKTGMVQMPGGGEEMLGGHAILVVGYSMCQQRFLVRNSWGNWGLNGYFSVPFDYFTDGSLADDFWLCQRLS